MTVNLLRAVRRSFELNTKARNAVDDLGADHA